VGDDAEVPDGRGVGATRLRHRDGRLGHCWLSVGGGGGARWPGGRLGGGLAPESYPRPPIIPRRGPRPRHPATRPATTATDCRSRCVVLPM